MEKTLRALFDLQRFLGNDRLAEIIFDTERRYGKALSDDELEGLSAAGEPFARLIRDTSEDKPDD